MGVHLEGQEGDAYKASVVCMGLGGRLMGAIFLVCFKLLALHAEIEIWFGC